MQIISVPHQTLRQEAAPITDWTEELQDFADQLGQTLENKDNPKGVGLAAPQVNTSLRIFSTLLTKDGVRPTAQHPSQLQIFINPKITATSRDKTFGEDPNEPTLEGCLSIPFFYGPVPRWEWAEFEWQTPKNGKLVKQTGKFTDFAARVMQHELDHLNGVLFTDYILEYDLPLYEEQNGKLKKVKNTKAKKF